ncbi:metal cation symporter ZIP8-like [Tachypleus tridentatus]|uniref:metal cation symporter ZIP8-like n=1 Tax=Tachypleus tridentatus TaxID=6853 RepID=UPI003FD0782D
MGLSVNVLITCSIMFISVIAAESEKELNLEPFARVAFNKYVSLFSTSSVSPTNKFSFEEDFKLFVKELRSGVLFENIDNKKERNCSSLQRSTLTDSDVLCQAVTQCISPTELFNLVPNSTKSLSDAITQLCPVLLVQQRTGDCEPETVHSSRPSTAAIWGLGILFVTIISCCSLGGVILMPLMNKRLYQKFIVLFEGLAVGSLLSSAIFHLIPQSFGILENDAHHSYLWKSLIIFGGVYLFFLTERFLKFVGNAKQKRKLKKSMKSEITLSVSVSEMTTDSVATTEPPSNVSVKKIKPVDTEKTKVVANEKSTEKMNGSVGDEKALSNHHDHHIPAKEKRVIGTIAWMIIFGDGLHNFIDGLSIGAAFTSNILSGISISLAVFCEELPHELGDFAVLLSAGMTIREAVIYNFLSACTCYVGLVFGILLGDFTEGTPHIFALAGGMFLYISLVDMMGELNQAMEKVEKEGVKASLQVFLFQNIGILIGVIILFILALYSERINFTDME